MIKKLIKDTLFKNKIILSRKSQSLTAHRLKLLDHFNINALFDIGANAGQYASELRKYGYAGRIISFEPMNKAYQELSQNSQHDELWLAQNIALGNKDEKSNINISENSYSSSLLEILPEHTNSAPESRYVETEEITVKRFDSLASKYITEQDSIFVKIDTQGYEMNVLDGIGNFFDQIKGFQIEASLVPLYANNVLFLDIISYMTDKGFHLMGLEPGFRNPETGQLLQVDCIFFRQKN